MLRWCVLLAVAAVGCGKLCTLIACEDSLTLDVKAPDGGRLLQFRGEITLDGEAHAFTCPAANAVFSQYRCDTDGLMYISLSSIGRPGESRVIGGTPPAMLPLTIEAEDGGLSWSRTLTPSYVADTPNGPGCGPTCYSHRESVTLETR